MIGIKLQGRLGNQMFQVSSGARLAHELQTKFYLDDSAQQNYLIKYFVLKRFDTLLLEKRKLFIKLLNFFFGGTSIITLFFKQIYFPNKKRNTSFQIIQQDGTELPAVWNKNIIDNALYEGFFQSSEYLPPSDLLNKYFKIKLRFRIKFAYRYKKIFHNFKTIVVHVRRTDYVALESSYLGGKDLSLPFSYYQKCLGDIKDIDKYRICFISDDIEYVKRNVKHKENYFFETNNEVIDLQLLINADILILANSSFSWWGAYLNYKKDKIVYAPKYWLGFKIAYEFPVGVIDKSWKQIEVDVNHDRCIG